MADKCLLCGVGTYPAAGGECSNVRCQGYSDPECPRCGGGYNAAEYKPGICRHCIPDVACAPGNTLCVECLLDDQICPECGYPEGS